jgi:hypothetical protein
MHIYLSIYIYIYMYVFASVFHQEGNWCLINLYVYSCLEKQNNIYMYIYWSIFPYVEEVHI